MTNSDQIHLFNRYLLLGTRNKELDITVTVPVLWRLWSGGRGA